MKRFLGFSFMATLPLWLPQCVGGLLLYNKEFNDFDRYKYVVEISASDQLNLSCRMRKGLAQEKDLTFASNVNMTPASLDHNNNVIGHLTYEDGNRVVDTRHLYDDLKDSETNGYYAIFFDITFELNTSVDGDKYVMLNPQLSSWDIKKSKTNVGESFRMAFLPHDPNKSNAVVWAALKQSSECKYLYGNEFVYYSSEDRLIGMNYSDGTYEWDIEGYSTKKHCLGKLNSEINSFTMSAIIWVEQSDANANYVQTDDFSAWFKPYFELK